MALLDRIDDLYAGVVTAPDAWDDASLAEWFEDAGADPDDYTKETVRELRRSVRCAQRMRDFWLVDDPSRPDDLGDWRTRVDLAMGARAWRPPLALAQDGLRTAPSAELFEAVQERFRVVNSERWMDGVTYAEWIEKR